MKFELTTNAENGFKLKTEASGEEERATVERLTLALIEKEPEYIDIINKRLAPIKS